MATLKSTSKIESMKENILKSMHISRVWVKDPNNVYTAEEFSKIIPVFKYISGNPEIIGIEGKFGIFLKMSIPIEGGGKVDIDLCKGKGFEPSFHEGDIIDKASIRFCKETCTNEEEHWYATGKVVE